MSFSSTADVREEIAKYVISRGVTLKYVRSELGKIRVKCEDGCPFLLYVIKDGSNPGLELKTLVPEHNCYRIFKNPRAFAKIIALLFNQKILKRHDYKLKALKHDAEQELRVHGSYYKCKRS